MFIVVWTKCTETGTREHLFIDPCSIWDLSKVFLTTELSVSIDILLFYFFQIDVCTPSRWRYGRNYVEIVIVTP